MIIINLSNRNLIGFSLYLKMLWNRIFHLFNSRILSIPYITIYSKRLSRSKRTIELAKLMLFILEELSWILLLLNYQFTRLLSDEFSFVRTNLLGFLYHYPFLFILLLLWRRRIEFYNMLWVTLNICLLVSNMSIRAKTTVLLVVITYYLLLLLSYLKLL